MSEAIGSQELAAMYKGHSDHIEKGQSTNPLRKMEEGAALVSELNGLKLAKGNPRPNKNVGYNIIVALTRNPLRENNYEVVPDKRPTWYSWTHGPWWLPHHWCLRPAQLALLWSGGP